MRRGARNRSGIVKFGRLKVSYELDQIQVDAAVSGYDDSKKILFRHAHAFCQTSKQERERERANDTTMESSGKVPIPSDILFFCSNAIILVVSTCFVRYYYTKPKKGAHEYNGINRKDGILNRDVNDDDKYTIKTLEELRRVIPAGASGTCLSNAPKVLRHLDDQMNGFIRRSPFVHLATCGKDGTTFVSPKGDAPGFVTIVNSKKIIIPDRPGNRLIFGLQSIIEKPNVGLCFQIPGNDTTLRMGGRASLSCNPQLLADLAARHVDATIAIVVEIEYTFFHCSKAYIRSKIWKPESWPRKEDTYKVTFGSYFSKISPIQSRIDKDIETHYKTVQDAVDGKVPEPN